MDQVTLADNTLAAPAESSEAVYDETDVPHAATIGRAAYRWLYRWVPARRENGTVSDNGGR